MSWFIAGYPMLFLMSVFIILIDYLLNALPPFSSSYRTRASSSSAIIGKILLSFEALSIILVFVTTPC